MDLETVINERTSVRRYIPSKPLDITTIEYLVRLGMRAPSPKNRQPWQVIHLAEQEKDEFVNMGLVQLEAYKRSKAHYGSLEISLNAMKTASNLLFIYNPYDDLPDYKSVWEKSDLQAIGAFVEYILLGAKSIGLGTLWMNDVYFIQEETKAFLHVEHELQAIVAIGVPDDGKYPRPRKVLDEVLIKSASN